jgi:hypothetical protein
MNKSKQAREYIALGVLVLVLVIAVVSFVRGNQSKPAPAEAKSTTQAKKPDAPEKKTAANSADWVEAQKSRVSGLVGEVKGGRNPFKDLLMPVQTVTAPPPPRKPEPGKEPDVKYPSWPSGILPIDYLVVEQPVKLKYISWEEAAQAVKAAAGNAVTLHAIKNTRIVKLRGAEEAMPDALEAIAGIDVAPDFQLRGVITTSTANFAVISVQGKTYSLYEGETIPALGWTVTRITPVDVTLRKGHYDPVVKRLAGGKA